MHFIYVMRDTDKEKVLALGYNLIKADEKHNIWVFENNDTLSFSCDDIFDKEGIPFVLSDVLTF